MSLGKVAGPALAIICGVCTAYTTFAPELQKQQAERLGEFSSQHDNGDPINEKDQVTANSQRARELDPGLSVQPPNQTAISNEASVGAAVKEAIHSIKEPQKQTSWPGLSLFGWSFGGADAAKSPGKRTVADTQAQKSAASEK